MIREIFESARSLTYHIMSVNMCVPFLLKLFSFSLLKSVDGSPVMNMHVLESTSAKICKPKGQRSVGLLIMGLFSGQRLRPF